MVARTVRLVGQEREQLQSAMHDIQFSVFQYYRHSTGWPDPGLLTTPARSTVGFIQKVHDVLSHDAPKGGVQNAATYRQLFGDRLKAGEPGAETIEAFRYLRNVGQHLVHPVDPDPTAGAVIGGIHGMRSYNLWAPVPRRAYNRLNPSTQKLKELYRSRLEGQSITDTFLTSLRFFGEVCPKAVHRSGDHDEWTWFPLRDQPGVDSPLHPDEPLDQAATLRWLRRRKPGGDLRLIAAQLTLGGEPRLIGFTFAGNTSYTSFVESHAQVARDIARGYPYFCPTAIPTLVGVPPVQEFDGSVRGAFRAEDPIDDVLGEVLITAPPIAAADWTSLGKRPEDIERIRDVCVNAHQLVLDLPEEDFLVYRCRRLYAGYPIV